MPKTPEEVQEELQRRILALEEKNSRLEAALESRADKSAIEKLLKENRDELAATRQDLATFKKEMEFRRGPGRGDPDTEDDPDDTGFLPL